MPELRVYQAMGANTGSMGQELLVVVVLDMHELRVFGTNFQRIER